MSAERESDRSEKDTTLQKRFRLIGLLILVAGLLAAAVIAKRAAPEDENAEAILSGNAKRYAYEMERIGGQSNVLAAELRGGSAVCGTAGGWRIRWPFFPSEAALRVSSSRIF